EASIQTIVAYDAIRLRQIEILQLTFQQTGDYRLRRELPVAVDDSDVRTASSVETHTHVPTHHSLLWTNNRADVVGDFVAFFDYLGRFVVATLDVVSDEHELPRKVAVRQRSLQTLHEWNDILSASVAKDYQRKMGLGHASMLLRIPIWLQR